MKEYLADCGVLAATIITGLLLLWASGERIERGPNLCGTLVFALLLGAAGICIRRSEK
jgi:hypothetical protein